MDIKIPFEPVRFDVDATDQFVRSNGLILRHYKAVVCPIGMSDPLDSRAPGHGDHPICENGYIYRYAGEVRAMLTNNSAVSSLQDFGLLDGSVFNSTFALHYEGTNEPVYVQIYDRFYLKSCAVLVPNGQLVEASITGVDRLTYKAEKVDELVDSTGKFYTDADFSVVDGKIVWNTENRPQYDPNLGRGATYSVRYLYTPFLYAQRLMHEVRVFNQTKFPSGEQVPKRANYAVLLAREYYLYKKEKDESLEDSRKDLPSPRDGSFGPR